jgi:hypothetical protein
MKLFLKWTLIHSVFTGVNLFALLTVSFGYGFSEETPDYLNRIATFWATFVELLLFPINDFYATLPREGFLGSDLFYFGLYISNSMLWGLAIAMGLYVYRTTKT